jgi:hypothetical protein
MISRSSFSVATPLKGEIRKVGPVLFVVAPMEVLNHLANLLHRWFLLFPLWYLRYVWDSSMEMALCRLYEPLLLFPGLVCPLNSLISFTSCSRPPSLVAVDDLGMSPTRKDFFICLTVLLITIHFASADTTIQYDDTSIVWADRTANNWIPQQGTGACPNTPQ